jgi:acyl-CoA thioesterase FadM
MRREPILRAVDGFRFVYRDSVRFRDADTFGHVNNAKSFELEYELRAGERLVAEAKTVIVCFDYERGETVPVYDDWRAALSG